MEKKRMMTVRACMLLLGMLLFVSSALAFVSNDSDADGVIDDDDRCPDSNMTIGYTDNFGCECAQKTHGNCIADYTVDGRNSCCVAPNTGCEIRTTGGPFRATCCVLSNDPSVNTCSVGATYYPLALVSPPPSPSPDPCPVLSWADPNPVPVFDATVMARCCPQKVSLSPAPVYAGDRARFFLGCAFMEVGSRSIMIPPQMVHTRATYNLGDPIPLILPGGP